MSRIAPMTQQELEDYEAEGQNHDTVSITSSSASEGSASSELMSSHAMKMGFYSINLGSKWGQRMHAFHMVLLPLLPVFILLAQNGNYYTSFTIDAEEIQAVRAQVGASLDLAVLVDKLQEERSAVALTIFMRLSPTDDLSGLQALVKNKVNIQRFTLVQTFNATDTVLQNIQVWPDIKWLDYFETKLKFQIQHSIFRTKIREGEKGIFEVVNWYNDIIIFILDYISSSIHDSDATGFYRYIIAFKNLLRATEYSGKSGIYALRYFSQGKIDRGHKHDFIQCDRLRREYLSQTFNFMLNLRGLYEQAVKKTRYEQLQGMVVNYELRGGNMTFDPTTVTVNYFAEMVGYSKEVNQVVQTLSEEIEAFVTKELLTYEMHKTVPLALLITLILFIPIVVYITMQATTSMFQFSEIYNERVETYEAEKKKTEKLLTDLLPRAIIYEMKKGKIPDPEHFSSVSIFLCDIVGFTQLAGESTAHQIVDLLNTLYNLFDTRLENYDVYKVETIGDAYMVASGVPEPIDHHASELAKMALDLLAKVVTFEVQHKPGYKIKLRMGLHSGSCVAGVVGIKIPHYSVFGETVEIANLMESTGAPMKIQFTEETKQLLELDGTFKYEPRSEEDFPEKLGRRKTFWLIGRDMIALNARGGLIPKNGRIGLE